MNFAVKEKYSDVKNQEGKTIFHISVKDYDFQLARLLIKFGGNSSYNQRFLKDSDFIRFIVKNQHFDIRAAWNGNQDIVKLLLTTPGIDINTIDNHSALYWASRMGYYEIVKLFLTIPEIDVNLQGLNNWTALESASEYGCDQFVKLLLTVFGININAKNIFNETALIWASRIGFDKVVRLLIAVPLIDINTKGARGYTALTYAAENGHYDVVNNSFLSQFPTYTFEILSISG